MSEPVQPGGVRAAFRDLLQRPARFNLVLGLTLFGVWYALGYLPLRGRIDTATQRLAAERERLDLARDIEHLRRETGRLQRHLPEGGDSNVWVHFLMESIRQTPLRLVSLEPQRAVEVGPYRAAVLRVQVEGPYPDLEQFLRWLEDAPRLLRIDEFRIVPAAQRSTVGASAGTSCQMQLTVTGVNG